MVNCNWKENLPHSKTLRLDRILPGTQRRCEMKTHSWHHHCIVRVHNQSDIHTHTHYTVHHSSISMKSSSNSSGSGCTESIKLTTNFLENIFLTNWTSVCQAAAIGMMVYDRMHTAPCAQPYNNVHEQWTITAFSFFCFVVAILWARIHISLPREAVIDGRAETSTRNVFCVWRSSALSGAIGWWWLLAMLVCWWREMRRSTLRWQRLPHFTRVYHGHGSNVDIASSAEVDFNVQLRRNSLRE